jgi:hypothetical protein
MTGAQRCDASWGNYGGRLVSTSARIESASASLREIRARSRCAGKNEGKNDDENCSGPSGKIAASLRHVILTFILTLPLEGCFSYLNP